MTQDAEILPLTIEQADPIGEIARELILPSVLRCASDTALPPVHSPFQRQQHLGVCFWWPA
jgi:hypothetical protein